MNDAVKFVEAKKTCKRFARIPGLRRRRIQPTKLTIGWIRLRPWTQTIGTLAVLRFLPDICVTFGARLLRESRCLWTFKVGSNAWQKLLGVM